MDRTVEGTVMVATTRETAEFPLPGDKNTYYLMSSLYHKPLQRTWSGKMWLLFMFIGFVVIAGTFVTSYSERTYAGGSGSASDGWFIEWRLDDSERTYASGSGSAAGGGMYSTTIREIRFELTTVYFIGYAIGLLIMFRPILSVLALFRRSKSLTSTMTLELLSDVPGQPGLLLFRAKGAVFEGEFRKTLKLIREFTGCEVDHRLIDRRYRKTDTATR